MAVAAEAGEVVGAAATGTAGGGEPAEEALVAPAGDVAIAGAGAVANASAVAVDAADVVAFDATDVAFADDAVPAAAFATESDAGEPPGSTERGVVGSASVTVGAAADGAEDGATSLVTVLASPPAPEPPEAAPAPADTSGPPSIVCDGGGRRSWEVSSANCSAATFVFM